MEDDALVDIYGDPSDFPPPAIVTKDVAPPLNVTI